MMPTPTDDSSDDPMLSILELIAYYGARAVEPPIEPGPMSGALSDGKALAPDAPWHCCGHAFATFGAWLQHQRVVHPGVGGDT